MRTVRALYVGIGALALLVPCATLAPSSNCKAREHACVEVIEDALEAVQQGRCQVRYLRDTPYDHTAFIRLSGTGSSAPSLTADRDGRLVDPWGQPILYGVKCSARMGISAGPDRLYHTDDDIGILWWGRGHAYRCEVR